MTASQMKEYDARTSEEFYVAPIVLMEKAAMGVVHKINELVTGKEPILIVCGTGNNGGDGFAIARILLEQEIPVSCVLIGEEGRMSPETNTQLKSLRAYQIPIYDSFDGLNLKDYCLVVDALFGIGLGRSIEGNYKVAIEIINQISAIKVAVDIPSGVDTDTGNLWGTAVRADYTVTFAAMKPGLLRYPGRAYAGEVTICNIGITTQSYSENKPLGFYFTQEDLNLLPVRAVNGHKGSMGKVGFISGHDTMFGATMLSSKAAYRSGAGYVRVFTHEKGVLPISVHVPEVLITTYQDTDTVQQISDYLHEFTKQQATFVIGPAMGTDVIHQKILEQMLISEGNKLVLDADALTLIANHGELKALLKNRKIKNEITVLTPHPLEFARLYDVSMIPNKVALDELFRNIMVIGSDFAKEYGVYLVYKDAATIVFHPNGRYYINTSGNNGLATAGSGDVLAGMMGAFLSASTCHMEYEQICLSVYLHGLCADQVKEVSNEYALNASDLLDALKSILRRT